MNLEIVYKQKIISEFYATMDGALTAQQEAVHAALLQWRRQCLKLAQVVRLETLCHGKLSLSCMIDRSCMVLNKTLNHVTQTTC